MYILIYLILNDSDKHKIYVVSVLHLPLYLLKLISCRFFCHRRFLDHIMLSLVIYRCQQTEMEVCFRYSIQWQQKCHERWRRDEKCSSNGKVNNLGASLKYLSIAKKGISVHFGSFSPQWCVHLVLCRWYGGLYVAKCISREEFVVKFVIDSL